MSAKKLIVVFLFAVVFPTLSYAAVTINRININDKVVEGDEIKITGSGFGNWNSKSFIRFTIDDQSMNAEVMSWKDDEITLVVPIFPSVFKESDVKIEVFTGADQPETGTITAKYKTLSDELIQGIIFQKKQGFSDEFILNQFDKQISKEGFKKDGLHDFETIKLKAAGFNDDVIGKLARHGQRVSIGIAGIWLNETKDLVTSPILRIFLTPKSFFDPRKPFWSQFNLNDFPLPIPTGLFDRDRYDINIGYTTKTSTTDNGSEKKSYLLLGVSFELNRSALFNFGWALVPGDIDGKQKQIYFGITVDYNILKDLGILEKG